MMWGKHKESGVWIVQKCRFGEYKPKVIFGGGDRIIYLALGRFRLRLMKPHRTSSCSLCD